MKKILLYAGMILLFFLFQCSFFDYFRLADVVPNLMLILTVSVAIINGQAEGCLVGFLSGILLDLIFGYYVGIYGLGYMLIGYFAGIVNRIFYKEDITFPLLVIAGSDIVYGLYMYVVGFLIRGRMDFWFYLRRIILPECVYTVIVAIFVYRLILWLSQYIQKKGSENLIA